MNDDYYEQYPTPTGMQWRQRDPLANGQPDRFGTAGAEHASIDYHHPEDPGPAEPPPDKTAPDDEPTTWESVDLGPWLRGEITQPHPCIGISRSDGLQLVYPGREHAFVGETESGKTWLALGCVGAELVEGHRVVYIHYEEADPGSTIERLQLLGVDAALIAGQLRFVAPARPARVEWIADLLDPAPTLVVHDGVNEAMALMGADIMAADGAARFRRQLVVPFLRAGAASIACDHLPKDRDGRSHRDAYGSVHKGNALDGARILLEPTATFGRCMRGASYLFVTKDRPGQLRAHGRATKLPGRTFIGTLVVDDSQRDSPDFAMRFYAPRQDEQTAAETAATPADIVHEVIAALPDRTVGSLRALFAQMRQAGHQVRESKIRDAVDDLIVAGRVIERTGKRNATAYQAVLTAAQESDT
jgi:hypothetical protein